MRPFKGERRVVFNCDGQNLVWGNRERIAVSERNNAKINARRQSPVHLAVDQNKDLLLTDRGDDYTDVVALIKCHQSRRSAAFPLHYVMENAWFGSQLTFFVTFFTALGQNPSVSCIFFQMSYLGWCKAIFLHVLYVVVQWLPLFPGRWRLCVWTVWVLSCSDGLQSCCPVWTSESCHTDSSPIVTTWSNSSHQVLTPHTV